MNGVNYESQVIRLERHITQGLENDEPEVIIKCSIRVPIINQYFQTGVLPQLRITRYNDDPNAATPTKDIFTGKVDNISVENREATIEVLSIFQIYLTGAFPTMFDQPQDNFLLFSQENGLPSHLWTVFNRGIISINNNVVVVSNIYIPSAARQRGLISIPDDWFKGGAMVNTRTRESVTILESRGATITLLKKFNDLLLTDGVNLVPGYDGEVQTTIDKFGNLNNFGGCPLVPEGNINREGIRVKPRIRS